jgi:hypothetical protein
MRYVFCVVFLFLSVSDAIAQPNVRAGFQGGWLFAYATNPENRAYVCNFSYTYSYDDFGERKNKSMSGQFGVPAHANNVNVLKLTGGAIVNPSLDAWNTSCK